jgi:Transposase, Mutator family
VVPVKASCPCARLAVGLGFSWQWRTVELAIPCLRDGTYFPTLLEPRRRAERVLFAVVQGAYLAGVSTRRVEALVEAICIASLSKSEAFRLCAALLAEVEAFRIPAAGCTVARLTGGSASPRNRRSGSPASAWSVAASGLPPLRPHAGLASAQTWSSGPSLVAPGTRNRRIVSGWTARRRGSDPLLSAQAKIGRPMPRPLSRAPVRR